MSDSPNLNPRMSNKVHRSPDEDTQMNDPQDPQSSALGYEFEVKEQDRWLPIANGMCDPLLFVPLDSRALATVSLRRKLALA